MIAHGNSGILALVLYNALTGYYPRLVLLCGFLVFIYVVS